MSPRRCFLEPVPQIAQAAGLLSAAANAHFECNSDRAAALIREADLPEIGVWYRRIVGPFNVDIHGTPPKSVTLLPTSERKKPRMPVAAVRKQVLERDGYYCRFCESPVLPKDVISALARVYPDHARWSLVASEQHTFFQAMTLQYDHVFPHSRGGDSSVANIVITCAACNYGRINWTLEEVNLIDPRTRPARGGDWDGMRVCGH